MTSMDDHLLPNTHPPADTTSHHGSLAPHTPAQSGGKAWDIEGGGGEKRKERVGGGGEDHTENEVLIRHAWEVFPELDPVRKACETFCGVKVCMRESK